VKHATEGLENRDIHRDEIRLWSAQGKTEFKIFEMGVLCESLRECSRYKRCHHMLHWLEGAAVR